MVLDYDLTSDPTDYASLVPLTESSKEFLGSDKMESLSDRGYFSMNNVKSMADDDIDAYIPEAKHGMPDKKREYRNPNSMNPNSYTTAGRISLCVRRRMRCTTSGTRKQ